MIRPRDPSAGGHLPADHTALPLEHQPGQLLLQRTYGPASIKRVNQHERRQESHACLDYRQHVDQLSSYTPVFDKYENQQAGVFRTG